MTLANQRADYWRGYQWTAETTIEAWAAGTERVADSRQARRVDDEILTLIR